MGRRLRNFRRRLWEIIRDFGGAVSLALSGVGWLLDLTDRPEQVAKLERWIGDVMADPNVHALAEWLSKALSYLNDWWVQAILLSLGLVLLFWKSRLIWKARTNAVFFVRRAVTDQVWISVDAARHAVRESLWARERWRAAQPKKDIWEMSAGILSRDPAADVRSTKFWHWCEKALAAFAASNSEATREVDGNREFDEVKLKQYLAERYDDDVVAEFGSPY